MKPSRMIQPSVVVQKHGYDEDAENREPGHVPDRRIDDVFRITAAHKLQPGAAQIANTSAVLGGKVGPEKIFMGNSIDTASDSIDPGRFMPPVEGQHMAEREPASSCNSNSGASDSRRESTSPRCSASLGNGEVTFRESERKAPSTPTGPASKSPGLHSPGYVADTRLSTPDSAQAPEEDENIKVMVRVRPPTGETEANSKGSLPDYERKLSKQGGSSAGASVVPRAKARQQQNVMASRVRKVSGEATSQDRMFKMAGRPMVQNVLEGYNSCIFAYGQTGSGKTYTMMGPSSSGEERGIMPRVFEALFEHIAEAEQNGRARFFLKCSYVEIYNEQLKDLLSDGNAPLQVREDARRGVYVEGLSEHSVSSMREVLGLLEAARGVRRVASTRMNAESSRSHAVFMCTVEQRGGPSQGLLTSRLNLVDLAGSERQRSTGATGGELREACNINRSLSALGHVIMALVEVSKGRQRHVPYRDSRLSFLLQDSLGGNSKTVMVACVSPSYANVGETLSTLYFARNAKCIKNRAVINEDQAEDAGGTQHVAHHGQPLVNAAALKREVARLKAEIQAMRGGEGVPLRDLPASPMTPPLGRSAGGAAGTRVSASPSAADMALAAALRREGEARARSHEAEARMRALEEVVASKDREIQQCRMVIKLREERIQRMDIKMHNSYAKRTPGGSPIKGKSDLESKEVELLKAQLAEAKEGAMKHPELLRLFAENQRLSQELRALEEMTDVDGHRKAERELEDMGKRLADALEEKERLRQQKGGQSEEGGADASLKQKCDALAVEMEALRAELQDKSYQLADAVAQKMRMEAVALVAERREQDLRAELQAREVEVMETQSRLAESQARLTEAERSLGASSHRKDSMVKEIGELSHQLEEAQRALETQRTKAEEASETACELQAEARRLKHALECARSELNSVSAELEEARGELERKERELVEASAAAQEARQGREETGARQAEWELKEASYEQQLTVASEKIKAYSAELQETREERDAASCQLHAAKEERAALKEALGGARHAWREAEAERDDARAQGEGLKGQAEAWERRARELEGAAALAEQMKSALTGAEAEAGRLRGRVGELERVAESARAARAEREALERRAGELEKEAARLREERGALQGEAEAMQERCARAEREAAAAAQRVSELESALAAAAEKAEVEMAEARGRFEAELEELRGSMAAESTSVSRAFEHQVRSMKEAVREQKESMEARVQSLVAELDKAKRDREGLHAEARDAVAEAARAKREAEEAEKRHAAAMEAFEAAQLQRVKLAQASAEEASRRARELESRLEEAERERARSQSECEGCKRVEELERKVEEAQKAAEEVQMRARVEVSAMEFSLKQEGQRLREALQKAHDLKKRLIHAYANMPGAPSAPLSPISQAAPSPQGGAETPGFTFRTSGDDTRRSAERRDTLMSKVQELERKLLDLAQAAERDSPSLRSKAVSAGHKVSDGSPVQGSS